MPRAAVPKKATAAKPKSPKKPKAKKKATVKKAAAPVRRVILQPSSGETLKQNATQLEVAERMLAEIASREQADTDPAVAAQRALRAAIASGAIPAGATILKASPKFPSQNELDAQARLDAQKAAAKAARDTAKAQANAREWEAMWRRVGGPAPPAIALGAPVMGGPIPAPAPPPPPPPIMPPTGPPVPPAGPPPAVRRVPPPVTADALATAMAALTSATPRPATAPVGPDPASLAAQAAKLARKFGKQEDRLVRIESQRAARQAGIQAAANEQKALERELVAAVARREEARREEANAIARARAIAGANEAALEADASAPLPPSPVGRPLPPRSSTESNNLAIQQMVDRAFSNIEAPSTAPLPPRPAPVAITGTKEEMLAQVAAQNAARLARVRALGSSTTMALPVATQPATGGPLDAIVDFANNANAARDRRMAQFAQYRPGQMTSSGTQTGVTGPPRAFAETITIYDQLGVPTSSFKFDSKPLKDHLEKGTIYQEAETGRYVWAPGVKIPHQSKIKSVSFDDRLSNIPEASPEELDVVRQELEGAGLYGYGDTPPRPKTSASKSGRRVLPGYSHADTMAALRNLVAQTHAQADAAERQNQRLQANATTLRAFTPKAYATVTTQTDPMMPTMTVFNSRTMAPYTVSMATYQKNYNKGNIAMDADGRPVFVVKAHRDANQMIADQEMTDYINELLAEMPEPEGAGHSSNGRSEIQAVGFPADEWTPAQARKWMSAHGAKPIKGMRREGTWLRWRITPPDLYRSYTTKTLKSNGKTVHLILGWL